MSQQHNRHRYKDIIKKADQGKGRNTADKGAHNLPVEAKIRRRNANGKVKAQTK
jgi:hypothetical protein